MKTSANRGTGPGKGAIAAGEIDESANKSRSATRRSGDLLSRVYRRPATFHLTGDGRLEAIGTVQALELTSDEKDLYREFAALVGASDQRVVAFASAHGPLGISAGTWFAELEQDLAYLMGPLTAAIASQTDQLGQWIKAGGRQAVPRELAMAAYWLALWGAMDGEQLELLAARCEGAARLSAEERKAVGAALDELLVRHAAAAGQYLASGQGDGSYVQIPIAPSVTAEKLRAARRLLRAAPAFMAEDGGPVAQFSSGYFPRMLARVATLPGADALTRAMSFVVAETLAGWRSAAAEFALWFEAERLLRRLGRRGSATHFKRACAVLALLERRAGISGAPPSHGQAYGAALLSSRFESLLTLRLQQGHAFPLPERETVGTYARALWSLWPRITGRQPPRRCAWGGCSEWLPANAHGNRDFCDVHRAAAQLRRVRRGRGRKSGLRVY